jgi:hypothetical protein
MSDTAVQHHDEHETRDVNRRGLLLFGGLFALFLIGASVVLWLTFGDREGGFAAARVLGAAPPDGELQQRDQLARYRAAQTAELERLQWTDATRQFAKVPIEEAMQLLAGKGDRR